MNQQKQKLGKFASLMLVVMSLALIIFLVLIGCLTISGLLAPLLNTFGMPLLSASSVCGALLSVVIFKKLFNLLDV